MDSDRTPRPVTGPPSRNPNTRLPAAGPGPAVSSKHLEDAYARAHVRMATAPAAHAGFRLFWVREGATGWLDLPSGGAYAILGRHTNCDVVLQDNDALSLRHLLAATIDLADGPALRLLDLRTSVPFYLADDVPRTSIVASGPVAVRLGPYVIGGVPVDATPARAAKPIVPPSLPPSRVSEGSSLPLSIRPPMPGASHPAAQEMEDDEPVSYVTSMPPPAPLLELPRLAMRAPPPGNKTQALRGPPEPSGPVCARLTLQRAGRSATVDLTEGELDVGVLVGRSDRCHDGGLAAVLETSISRGHLLLLRQHGGFEAFDLCSTQGTRDEGRPVRRVTLSDEGTTLTLATSNPVTLTWERAR